MAVRALVATALLSLAMIACGSSPSSAPVLTLEAGTISPLVLVATAAGAPGEAAQLQISDESRELGSAHIALVDAIGMSLWNPVAMTEIPDTADASARRVYVVCAGAGRDQGRGITETIVRAIEGGLSITVGRVFNIPVRGSMEDTNLWISPDSSQLFVNLPAPQGDPSQPVMLVYDIQPESTMTDPVDIRMVPRM